MSAAVPRRPKADLPLTSSSCPTEKDPRAGEAPGPESRLRNLAHRVLAQRAQDAGLPDMKYKNTRTGISRQDLAQDRAFWRDLWRDAPARAVYRRIGRGATGAAGWRSSATPRGANSHRNTWNGGCDFLPRLLNKVGKSDSGNGERLGSGRGGAGSD